MRKILLGVLMCFLSGMAVAGTDTPYAGQEKRTIKSLSAQEVEGYLEGKGLGYAKTAELNHYPGPKHVLELRKELNLTEAQQMQTQAIFVQMQKQAIALGEQLVEQEQVLDRRFAEGSITPDALNTLTTAIGTLQAKIRYVHLSAHLQQQRLLSVPQVELYDRLRGYGLAAESSHDPARHHH